jgi:hypothetical protein
VELRISETTGVDPGEEERFNAALDAADKALGEMIGIGLAGSVTESEPEISEALVVRLWDHVSRTVTALAVLHNETPRTIANDLFEHLGEDEAHRADIEKRVEEIRRLAEEGRD